MQFNEKHTFCHIDLSQLNCESSVDYIMVIPGFPGSFVLQYVFQHDGLTEKDAWFVDQVEITNTSTKKTWLFKCSQWFSLHHTDCQIARTLHAISSAKTGVNQRLVNNINTKLFFSLVLIELNKQTNIISLWENRTLSVWFCF